MWGFVYRATIGALRRFPARPALVRDLVEDWLAVASLPFVYARLGEGFLGAVRMVPAKSKRSARHLLSHSLQAARRARKCPAGTLRDARHAYDIGDLSEWDGGLAGDTVANSVCTASTPGTAWIKARGIGPDRSRHERDPRSASGCTGCCAMRTRRTYSSKPAIAYDSTVGYNETIGYRAGTGQVFRPSGRGNAARAAHAHPGWRAVLSAASRSLGARRPEERCQRLI